VNRRNRETARTKELRARREWLLYLLAGQPRRRINYRPFLERATRMFKATWEDGSYSDKQIRESVRYDLGVLASLKPRGAVRLEKPREDGQVRYVVLSRGGARRWLWAVYVQSVLRITADLRSASVRRIADGVGRHERTVWRWFAGDSVPSARDASEVLHFFVRTALSPKLSAAEVLAARRMESPVRGLFGSGLLYELGEEMKRRGFTKRERARSLKYIEERIVKPFLGLYEATLMEDVT